MTRTLILRVLCGAWLFPAASLIWIGLAATGLRRTTEASLVLALGRTQALSVVLAVFTILVGASAFIRREPTDADATVDPDPDPGPADLHAADLGWLTGHGLAAAVAGFVLLVGATIDRLQALTVPTAALLGLAAALALPRALLRCRGAWSGPLAALAVGAAFQLTIGWLPLIHPAGISSPALAVAGLLLAWAAATAARVDPFDAPVDAPAAAPRPAAELVASSGPFSPTSAPPSLPEAMAGR